MKKIYLAMLYSRCAAPARLGVALAAASSATKRRLPTCGLRRPALCLATILLIAGSAFSQSVTPNKISFGQWVVNTTSTPVAVTFQNGTTSKITINSITTSGNFAQTSNCPLSPNVLAAGARCTIQVTFTPTVVGSLTGSLAINDTSGTQTASLKGTGVLPVTLSSSSLSFAGQVVNTTSTAKTVTLKNLQTVPLTITSTSITGDFAQTNNCPLAPLTLAAGGSCTFSITFTPRALGTRTGSLSISDSAPTSPQSVSLSGNGNLSGLSAIAVTPASASINTGFQQQFTATGTFSGGVTSNITNFVTWKSSNTVVATVGATGLASALSAGTTTIKATSGTISGSATLAVTPVLQTITVTPSAPSIAKGQTQPFTATGTYSDRSTQNLTSTVTWSSSSPGVATISSGGVAFGAGVGTTTVAASLGTVSGSTTLTVNAAALVSIAVTPANAPIALGTNQQFTATGTYTDGSTLNITAAVSWSSSSPGVATVSNVAQNIGQATSVSTGQTTITASSGAISGSTVLTVTPAALLSITVTPAIPTIPLGSTTQFTATGSYSDGSTQNITGTVTWASSALTVATISNTAGSNGLATSAGTGQATITATSGSISGSTTLTVSAAALSSVAVSPANASIALGTTQQFTVTGTYTDGSQQNLTSSATWSSSDTTIFTVSATGLATSSGVGTATLTATVNGVSGSTSLTVTPAALVSIALTPSAPSIALGTTQQFVAIGTFTDGTTQDLTASSHWTSSAASVATVSNTTGTAGLVTSLGTGTTSITATSNSVSGTATLTVTPAASCPSQLRLLVRHSH